jgi:hypothetical protein
MSISPSGFAELSQLSHLRQTNQLFNTGQLHYYNITNQGPKEKGFLGKVWAWILNFISYQTNLSNYIFAVNKYLQETPADISTLTSRLILTYQTNEEAEETAQFVNDIFRQTPLFDFNENSRTKLNSLFQATDYDRLKGHLEAIKTEVEVPDQVDVDLPDNCAELDDVMKKYFFYIHEGKRNKDFLLEQFNQDCARTSVFFQDRETKKTENFSFSKIHREQQKDIDAFKADLEEKLRQSILSSQPDLTEELLMKQLETIKMFLNQTVGVDLLSSNPKYTTQINRNMPACMLSDEEISRLEDFETVQHYAPILPEFSPQAYISTDAKQIAYEGRWSIKLRNDEPKTLATAFSSASIDFATQKFRIRPISSFKVAPDCNLIEIQRLAARYLRN